MSKRSNPSLHTLSFLLLLLLFSVYDDAALAQGTAFTYQGRLTDGGSTANGTYEMRFKIFDALTGGAQQPQPVPITIDLTVANGNAVTVTDGVFAVKLDFSASSLSGADRWLEIAVRKTTDPPGFTLLTPRQPLTSSPYAVQTLRASSAAVADNVSGVVGIFNGGTGLSFNNIFPPAGVYLRSNGAGWAISGLQVLDLPPGSASYIQNRTSPQTSTNFNISGNGTVGGILSGNGSGLTNLNGANLDNLSVTTPKIADGSVTAAKLAAGALGASITNISLLAQLRWDVLTQVVSVGPAPYGIAFDGVNLWTANSGSSSVTKVRASDGAILGTFPVTTAAWGIAFDGANIWTAGQGSSFVTKLRASDGANLGTFAVGTNPFGIAFDGANIWVANASSNDVTKLRASDGANLGTFPVGLAPVGLAYDGANMWVGASDNGKVTKLRASDGANLGTFTLAVGSATGLAFDGANVWVTGGNTVTKLRSTDGANLGTFAVSGGSTWLAFDGTNVWVANGTGNTLTKLRGADGVILGVYPAGTTPFGVAFDGANIWVTNSGGNTIFKHPVF